MENTDKTSVLLCFRGEKPVPVDREMLANTVRNWSKVAAAFNLRPGQPTGKFIPRNEYLSTDCIAGAKALSSGNH